MIFVIFLVAGADIDDTYVGEIKSKKFKTQVFSGRRNLNSSGGTIKLKILLPLERYCTIILVMIDGRNNRIRNKSFA